MRTVIQRVSKASVTIGSRIKSSIDDGMLVLIGIEEEDNISDIDWLANKIVQLRIFNDNNGVMNRSILETEGNIMIISQFTLHAKTKKGNRPSYIRAAKPEKAIPLYECFIKKITDLSGKYPATGEFGAMMQVELINDGPVTIIIDTKEKD
jgi:D-aminoacyl-tRNA deacylase